MLSRGEIEDIRARMEHNPAWTIDIISREQIKSLLDLIVLLMDSLGPPGAPDDGVREWVMYMVMREMRSHDNEYGYPRKLPDGEKIKILAEETGEVARAMQDGDRKHLVTEYVQVAAVAIQHAVIVEQEGENYVR